MTVFVRAEFQVRPADLVRFLDAARALATAAADEPGTLRYAWFSTDDPETFVVLEEYADPEAALAHNDRCAAFLRAIAEVSEMPTVQLHGDLGPDVAAWVIDHPQARAHAPLRL